MVRRLSGARRRGARPPFNRGFAKAMHAQGPLISDESTLHCWKKPKRQDERKCRPNHRVQPNWRVGPEFFSQQHQSSNNMAHDEDRYIRRGIVGPLVEKFLGAMRAGIVHLEIGTKYAAGAAVGTETAQPSADCIPCVPLILHGFWDFSHSCHCPLSYPPSASMKCCPKP